MTNDEINFKDVFEFLPASCLLLNPKLQIIAVTDRYLTDSLTIREDILNKHLFDVFPDDPDDKDADGVSNLSASLTRVINNKVSDKMPVQKYNIRNADGIFVERYWNPINSPVLNTSGDLMYIIHRVDEITALVDVTNRLKKLDGAFTDLTEILVTLIQ